MRKLGINLQGDPEVGMGTYLQLIKSFGFDTIFSGVWESGKLFRTANMAANVGLTFETLHAPFKHINDIWYEGHDGNCMFGELAYCVDMCREIGASIAVVHLSSGEQAPPLTDVGRKRFSELVEYAAARNVKIAFENQRKLANIAWAMEEFQEAENVGFCWDCGHEACFTQGREYMLLFGDRLICTHIHDNYKIYNNDMHLIPFDGKVDFHRVAELIRESGYQGPLTLELLPKNSNVYQGVSCEEYLMRASAAAKRLRHMIDGENA